jgi:hypothetical protein
MNPQRRAVKRVPASLAVLALRQSGYHLSAVTLRQWVHRGHVTRGPGGYCLAEIVDYIDRRQNTPVTTSLPA